MEIYLHLIRITWFYDSLSADFWIQDLDLPVEGMSSTTSTQPSVSSGGASTSAGENARPPDPGDKKHIAVTLELSSLLFLRRFHLTVGFVGTNSAGPARSRLSLQLDQRSLHFSVNAWVNILT